MITFIRGTVYSFGADYVIIDNNGIGYFVYFNHQEMLSLNQNITIFTYQHFREDATVLYGFIDKKELDLFTQLITVKGLGPKTAITMLGRCRYEDLIMAIENGELNFLKSLPGIGAKMAQQIILDLKGKLVEQTNNDKSNPYLDEVADGLKALGYKTSEINSVLGELVKLDLKSTDEYLRSALKILAKRKGI
ncbi:MAG: Holliday junction branch migration protein RuvA [Erysipelotrichaceae bacterium]|nr:Holliday junction branch migration protein RuvA [Erysipelotrichaceae bacterium]